MRAQGRQAFVEERGTLAFAHTADGEVLPFAEVLCGRVRRAARDALSGKRLIAERLDFEDGHDR